jgi:hypothetical protein
MAGMSAEIGAGQHHVFLSYAHSDHDVARRVADELTAAGVNVWFDFSEVKSGVAIEDQVNAALSSSDVVVVLLSSDSVRSEWVKAELRVALSRDSANRGVTVVPALIGDCDLPDSLARMRYFDLRTDLSQGVARLAEEVFAVRKIDFSRLSPQQFEALVGDLLSEIGLSVTQTPRSRDGGFDFLAKYSSWDPFGTTSEEVWLVEAKLYRSARVGVENLRAMFSVLASVRGASKAVVVTSGRLTSAAREYLDMSAPAGEIRVIEGPQLVDLLMRHPRLVSRYFEHGDMGV